MEPCLTLLLLPMTKQYNDNESPAHTRTQGPDEFYATASPRTHYLENVSALGTELVQRSHWQQKHTIVESGQTTLPDTQCHAGHAVAAESPPYRQRCVNKPHWPQERPLASNVVELTTPFLIQSGDVVHRIGPIDN